jgi:hypothetical protein
MAVFVDIYGNEAREVIPAEKFGIVTKKEEQAKTKHTKTKIRKSKGK